VVPSPVTLRGSSTDQTAICDPIVFATEAVSQTIDVACSDYPWLNVGHSSYTLRYDGTAPNVEWNGPIIEGATYPVGSVPA
jgi:hypothetical protein